MLILSGNNWRNQEWTEEVERVVSEDFVLTWILKYENWKTHAAILDPEAETGKLAEKARDFGEYAVFAKSAGTILCMKAVKEGKLKPVKCMFVGTSIKWGKEQGWPVNEWVRGFGVPTLYVQKKDDPIMGFEELRLALEELEVINCKLMEIPGSSHHYERVFELKRLLKVWVKE